MSTSRPAPPLLERRRARTPPGVLAIVLTHNAPTALADCLRAIHAQTVPPDEILVVDNASMPRALVDTSTHPTAVLRREVNDGPAGGHAAGLDAFLASGHDLAWVMDDDQIPEPDCLARLVDRDQRLKTDRPIFPLWVERRTGVAQVRPAWCGFVISAGVVRRVGLPRADLVWWAEDTEYLQARMIDNNVAPVEERSAVVHHTRARAVAAKPAWKIYYETRNTIEYRVFVQRRTGRVLWYLAESLAKLGVQAVRHGPDRRRRVVAYTRGLAHGVIRASGLRMAIGASEAP